MTEKIILLSGPTATGKSSLALKIAETIGAEIINADSIQLYRDLSILTARPNTENEKIKHHCYGFLNGDINWSVGKWINEVKKIINDIIERKKVPIIVGGTGFYFKAITDGLSPIPDIDKSIRLEIESELEKNGLEKLYKKLNIIDVDASERINPNDKQRIMRALEVYEGTKKKISDFWLMDRKKIINQFSINFKIDADRDWIYKNCDLRVDNMFKNGVIEEVEHLLNKNYSATSPIMKAIGVNEIKSFLNNEISIDRASELIKFKTHHYAKRQITWMNNQMISWNSINTQYSNKIINEIIKKL
jgi:tRNA dimethylallyltransferase|tara:strand:- start:2835 stop:3746 length:912 start_codon:yes stop_codon:yes gene_type:complete